MFESLTDCGFCGLPASELEIVFGVSVCADCTDLAEIAFDESEVM